MGSLRQVVAAQVAAKPQAVARATTWIARHANDLAFVLVCCAGLFRVILISNGWPIFDSDQAVIGLMGRHIWLHGERPLFFYGQSYDGPVEAYAAVPVFALFGSSVLALRLAILPLILLFLVAVYVLGRLAYGPVVGLLALAWLALGPSMAVYRNLYTIGGKQEMLVLSGVILICVWARLRLPERRPGDLRAWLRCLGIYAVLGAACGLGVWSDWLSTPLVLLAVVVLLLARPRELLSWSVLALVLGFVIAAWPFIHYNVTNQFASVYAALHYSGSNSNSITLADRLSGLPSRLGSVAAIDLPALFGSPHVCVQSTADASTFPWIAEMRSFGDACSRLNEAFSLLLVALFALAAWPLARVVWGARYALRGRLPLLPRRILYSPTGLVIVWRRLDTPISAADARRSARLWLRGMLLLNAVALVFAFVYNPLDQVNPLGKSRYLLPLYLSVPLLFGALWEMLRPALVAFMRARRQANSLLAEMPPASDDVAARPQLARPRLAWSRQALALVAGAMLAFLLVLSVLGGRSVLVDSGHAGLYALPEPPAIARVLEIFAAHNVRTFYADSYYDCYRFIFDSNERQVCAVLGPDGQPAPESFLNPYHPYVTAVVHDPHPAYLLLASPEEKSAFQSGNLPGMGYVRTVVTKFAIYYYSSAAGHA